jgi:CDP-diacylglycerol--serine O-phosphatidyltransferase
LTVTVKNKTVYLLPNILTALGLFSGFIGIIAAIEHHFIAAIYAVFSAMILDGLDGRVARKTGTESEFGKEFDSLADIVSFGVAPAIILYSWSSLDLPCVVLCFVYVVAVALRLAKFMSQKQDDMFFSGLPCPAAAALVISHIWLLEIYSIDGVAAKISAITVLLFVAIAMVVKVPYCNFKKQASVSNISALNICLGIILLLLLYMAPAFMIYIIFLLYSFSGIFFLYFNKISCCKRICFFSSKLLKKYFD